MGAHVPLPKHLQAENTPLHLCPACSSTRLSPVSSLHALPTAGSGERQEEKSRKVCIPASTALQRLYVQQSAPINPPSAWPARFITSP